jgi:hypothetical protein
LLLWARRSHSIAPPTTNTAAAAIGSRRCDRSRPASLKLAQITVTKARLCKIIQTMNVATCGIRLSGSIIATADGR